MTQTVRGEERFNRALYGSVIVFTLLSLFVGWWAASRVMSPVSELARRLQASGDSTSPEPLATHFPEDEVGQLASALADYAESLTEGVQRDSALTTHFSTELRTPAWGERGAAGLVF